MTLPNGRDLGGLATADGRRVRSGVLMRSALPRSPEHAAALRAIGVRRVVDLRTAEERDKQPPAVHEDITVVTADVLADEPEAGPASLGAIARAALEGDHSALHPDRLDEIFLAGYRSFVTLDSAREATATALRHLSDESDGATLIHCTAGKDRTGWVIAVALTSVGVPWETVMTDYLISGPQVLALFAPYREKLAQEGVDVAGIERAVAVFPAYLEAARDAALETYGSWNEYLIQGLGLTSDELQALRTRLVD